MRIGLVLLTMTLLAGCVQHQDVDVSFTNQTGSDNTFTITFVDGSRSYEHVAEVADGANVQFRLPSVVVQTYEITASAQGYQQSTRADVGGPDPFEIQLTAEPDRLLADYVTF